MAARGSTTYSQPHVWKTSKFGYARSRTGGYAGCIDGTPATPLGGNWPRYDGQDQAELGE
jgi:hypothetical protein